ncbi:MAG: ShlB/FhaC/HecB family hemolysin secretion/activation protein, partial [Cyanobacteria bacterium J06600_6]
SSQFILANNYSPSIGTFGGTINVSYHLLGFGDILGFGYTRTEGLTRYSGSYLLPINKYNGTIGLRYTSADTEIVENPISALDIKANFESFSLEVRQPVSFNQQTELAFAIQFELIESETFVDRDFSFAFVDGLENGKSNLSILRLTQEYFDRRKTSSIALRSQFNVGVDVFDPTVTEVGVDSLFWSWKGQGQWLKKIDNILLLSSLNVQFTDDKLLPIEQLSLGGVNSVRGYRQNLSIGDNGIVGSIELQVPLIQKSHWKLNFIPFVDAGTLWNNFTEDLDYSTLASVGLGVNFTLGKTIDAQIDYGIPLIEAEAPESFSTEERVSFRLSIQP